MIGMAKYFFKMNELKNGMVVRWKDRFDLEKYAESGYLILNKNKKEIKDKLNQYKLPEKSNEVDLTEVVRDWFPLKKYEIFISHSHSDEKEAVALSSYLKEYFGLNCFIDSCTWGYADLLLRKLDNKYCKEGEYYDYSCRNGTTAHVHLMLNSALMEMMQFCPIFIFLQTKNSLQTDREDVKNWTYSSWIYSELCMGRIMSNILYQKQKCEAFNFSEVLLESARLPMGYGDVATEYLKDISLGDIQYYLNRGLNGKLIFSHLYNRVADIYD